MKLKIVIAFIVVAVIIFFDGCENEGQTGLVFSGKVISHTDCKNTKSTFMDSDTPDTLSCVNYSFDAPDNKLIIKHINTGFNCCPGSLFCEVTLRNDIIIIEEFEEMPQCNCNCLFDLDIEITGVKAKKYRVQFIEPYAGNQKVIEFEMDLTGDDSGSVCVTRKNYPWGIYN
ncbi:MAG TPA: hypothetical protein VJ346_09285 [Bacteroidales bacterium]|nr:hypothetical protein [Bacteroidales bacterium]